ncbi:MAG: DNA-processing protein DprA [Alcaligenaceae bacterium]|nr:DNA-processing protein DprA [Alcaligenaceae bacterium]
MMKYTGNALNVMAARIYKGIGRAWIVKNLSSPKSDTEIVRLLNESSKSESEITVEDFNKKKSMLRRLLEASAGAMDGVVALGDEEFPTHRGKVKNSEKPIFLFYRGDLSLLSTNSKNIAVIGLLNPTMDIELLEREVVAALVKKGAVIVSGLANGCDAIAHRETLDHKGKTVAILPSPLSDIMPATNRPLAERIVDNAGLLISEYLTAPKSKMELSGRYQERDRLQALFSDSILLSASYAKNDQGNDSGSRLAMGYAKDYSIPRAVIYDQYQHATNRMFDLNRQIKQEDSDVIVINKSNMAMVLPVILKLKAAIFAPEPVQESLV